MIAFTEHITSRALDSLLRQLPVMLVIILCLEWDIVPGTNLPPRYNRNRMKIYDVEKKQVTSIDDCVYITHYLKGPGIHASANTSKACD